MLRQIIPGIMLVLLSLGMLACASTIQPVRAFGTIYIKADGSIDPSTAPILRTGDLYTFTSDIYDSIVVEKDNIVIDGEGYTVEGPTTGTGIDLSGRSNVTTKNMEIQAFEFGIYLDTSSSNTINASNISNNDEGISLHYSSSNTIYGNNITTNLYDGIYLHSSSYNSISGNNITANTFDGIYLYSSSNNTISGNNIANNGWGVTSYYSSDNRIFHNNLISNFEQVYSESSIDIWDNGYPSGGNFWDNYTGVDEKCGPKQDHLGSDGIGDTPYVIDGSNKDNYPLMSPWTPPAGHNVAVISVVPSKTVVGQDYSCSITVYGVNRGEYPENFNVTAYANTTTIASQAVTLTSGNSTAINFTWNTAGFAYGNYTVSAYAWPVQGETSTGDNTLSDGTVIISHLGDITGDGKCDIQDLARVSGAFGSRRVNDPNDPRYGQYWHTVTCPTCPHTPNADITNDAKIDIQDLARTSANFGWHE
jgi:parallel beta-helix repeat protein